MHLLMFYGMVSVMCFALYLQAGGPDWRTTALGMFSVCGALLGLIGWFAWKKVCEIDDSAIERVASLREEMRQLEREYRETTTALTLQITADREIRDFYHEQNLLALFHIMQAMKTGDSSKLEPELLFHKRLKAPI